MFKILKLADLGGILQSSQQGEDFSSPGYHTRLFPSPGELTYLRTTCGIAFL